MSVEVRLLAYVSALLVVFAATFATGRALGPADRTARETDHRMEEPGGGPVTDHDVHEEGS